MAIFTAITSIFVITALIWGLNKILPFKICPICAGVAGTWLWIVVGIYVGLLETENWRLIAAIAMGGSIVGIAYQTEKHLAENRSPFAWKILFIPTGFIAAYGIISLQLTAFVAAIILLGALALRFIKKPRRQAAQNGKKIEELKNKMENCC